MKNEMDLMNMDERQRLAWFMANRGTLIAVGAVWIGMIGWELTHGQEPVFQLIMVPVFALLRAGLYRLYGSKPFAGNSSAGSVNFVLFGKITAALLLAAATVLPLYSVKGLFGEETRFIYVWNLIRDDCLAVIPLSIIFLWPLLIYGLSRLKYQRLLSTLVQYTEPFLVVFSSILVLWISQLIFETTSLFFIPIFLNPVPDWGCYLAVAANGLYLVSWFAGLLRPWTVQE
ncbi:MAG: hypothetical protein KAR42_13430 [candidate division Zixibacteria bacterium]|nr:hypothetical protein [candidate division Zixibacteria bacterium]